jgi:hypothetical protein
MAASAQLHNDFIRHGVILIQNRRKTKFMKISIFQHFFLLRRNYAKASGATREGEKNVGIFKV